jgi:phage gp29-like protein
VQTQSGEVEVVAGDGSWLLYTPGGADRPWSHGAWRSIARWWLLKKYALADWGRHSEQAGGVKVATTDSGNDVDRRKLATDLATMGADATVALPQGWNLKLVEVAANTFETFRAQVDSANAAIAIALVGQNLSTEVKGGSFAAAQVHQQVAHAVLRGQAETLSTTLHAQALVWWSKFNFGSADAAPWPEWTIDPPEDDALIAATAKSVGEAVSALKNAGVEIDAQAFAERFGIPLLAGAREQAQAQPTTDAQPSDQKAPQS